MAKYVKAIFDFPSTEEGDLTICVNDVIQVVYEVDSNWLCGKLYGCVGNFPKNFVVPLELPAIAPGQKVFAAIKDFDSDVAGDLCFTRGELIKGTQQIDQNWWHGTCNGASGIFPITHVQELEAMPANDNATVTEAPSHGSMQEHTDKVIAKGQANMDLTAQLDDELSFYKGDLIEIVEILDSDFAIGICQGKRGTFPLVFVDIIEGSVNCDKNETKRRSKFDWWKEADQEALTSSSEVVSNTEYAADHSVITSQPSLQVNNGYVQPVSPNDYAPTTFTSSHITPANEDVHMIEAYRNSVPSPPSDHFSAPSWQSHRRNDSYNQQNTRSQDEGGVTPYGKILFPFVGENPNELTVFDNEIVTLIRHVDDQWIEGEVEGKRGIFPASYVEIIVDCPYDYDSALNTESGQVTKNLLETSQSTKKPLEIYTDDVFGCVLYDFTAEMDVDLNLHEGDTIRLLSKLNEDWYEAQTDDGQVGMCPVKYVEIIPAEPPEISAPTTVSNGKSCRGSEVMLSANSTMSKPDQQQQQSSPEHKPDKGSKPPILHPKPSLKTKPQPKPVSDASVAMETVDKMKPKSNPPRPNASPSLGKNFTIDSSLDDVIQKEIQQTKVEVGVVPSQNTLTKAQDWKSYEMPSEVKLESVAQTASYHKAMPGTDTAASKPSVPTRPPPIQNTRDSPKKTPLPKPREHLAPQSLPLESDTITNLGPKPIPERPAPPRPSARPLPSSRRKRSTDDLMEFSPDDNTAVMFTDDGTENMEVIQDLEKRIEEAERDVQKYERLKTESEADLMRTECEIERREIQDNIDFYKANVDGLTQEIVQLKDELFALNPERSAAKEEARQKKEEEKLLYQERNKKREALKQKHRETRRQVISEIIETEKDFLHSISLCFEAFFHTDVYKCQNIDAETLLGNINEVCEVSQMLLTKLEAATNGKHFDEQLIGPCFIELQDKMKHVYAPYCRNHDEVLALLAKYEKDPEIQACFNQMLDFIRQKMTVFDLGSVLIKPVQRILKYPLLLNELLKSTEDDHPDKNYLIKAIDAMTEVAAMINEYKRRKDLVLKYKNPSDVKFRERMARLNMHSTKKKLQRFGQMVVGVQTVDENFTREEHKFKSLESAVRMMVRDFSNYVETVQLTCQAQEVLANDISDYYSEHNGIQDVEQFCKVHSQIASKIYYRFREEVETNVITPLNSLLAMYQGPIKVIKKRYDKLLDYDNLSSRMKNLRDSEQMHSEKENLQMAKNNYEALNAQLLDELPKLYSLSLDVIYQCIGFLVLAQKDFYSSTLKEMYQMLGLQLVLGNDVSNIIETFNICHSKVVEQLSDISFIPKSFNPLIEERKATKESARCTAQSESTKAYLHQRYPPDKLYTVVQSVGASQTMDLELARGVLVGVIKESDPMGNKEHWFVDSGETKGFVMKHFLAPYQSASRTDIPAPKSLTGKVTGAEPVTSEHIQELISLEPELSSYLAGGQEGICDRDSNLLHENDQSENTSCSFSESDVTSGSDFTNYTADNFVPEPQYYQAVYPFTSRSDLEIDLFEGETVNVVEFHDQDGNNEWWLVEKNGRRGYAPANYLYKVQ